MTSRTAFLLHYCLFSYSGQQFTWHYDAIQPHLRDSSGNRIATLIVYLNDCESGGETVFRDLDLKVSKNTVAMIMLDHVLTRAIQCRAVLKSSFAVLKWKRLMII